MKLCDIIPCEYDIEVSGIAEDSRNIKEGYVFFATKGYNVDHFDYIEDALNKGAVAIVCDRKPEIDIDIVIVVDDVRKALIDACEKYYDVKTIEFKFIGITGTDGKTTTATLISRLIGAGYIGTNGLCYKDIEIGTTNTTPSICELYKCLHILKINNCKIVVMEVSSEALIHCRVDHIRYDVVCYTNITEDHLNIHKSIEDYVAAKKKLLNIVKEDGLIFINGDDDICREIKCNNLSSYGFDKSNSYVIKNVNLTTQSVTFDICFDNDVYTVTSPFREKFNIYNVCIAFIVCYEMGMDTAYLLDEVRKLKPINGRCEKLAFGQNYEIVLDYAHTYNAIKSIVSEYKDRRVIVVTGAAGGREKEKRLKIGNFLLNNCYLVIFTMDDPRWENVNDIIDQMIGNYAGDNYLRINDRKEAIYKSFELAKEGDVVLILGKGRDNYMAIEDRKECYCDYAVILDYFR